MPRQARAAIVITASEAELLEAASRADHQRWIGQTVETFPTPQTA